MALFDFLKKDPVTAFWRWFAANAEAITKEVRSTAREPIGDLASDGIQTRLHRIHPELAHEIGVDSEETIELIISADGLREAFPAVSRVVQAAPAIPGFKITAFRPRSGPDFKLGMFGKEIEFRQARYETWPEDDLLGLKLYIDVDLGPEELDAMGFLLLDMALGEYDVATGLGTIEVVKGRPSNAKPLKMLAEEFDSWRTPTIH